MSLNIFCRIDGNSAINVPTTLTLVVEDNTECQTKFRLQTLTGNAANSNTNNDVYVEFLVNDQWSDPYMFFNTTEKDELEVTAYCLLTCISDPYSHRHTSNDVLTLFYLLLVYGSQGRNVLPGWCTV